MATTKAKMKQFQQLERWKQAALDKANETRARLGKPPVDHLYKGKPGHSNHCPITNTIYDDDLDRYRYRVRTWDSNVARGIVVETEDSEFRVKHSIQSLAFVKHFDDGEYPELVEEN